MGNDILINKNGLIFSNGNFLIGSSNLQEINVIVSESPGNIKKVPQCGVNIQSYINSTNIFRLKSIIKYQTKLFGNLVKDVQINSDQSINIIAI